VASVDLFLDQKQTSRCTQSCQILTTFLRRLVILTPKEQTNCTAPGHLRRKSHKVPEPQKTFSLETLEIFGKSLNNKQQQGDELRICCQKLCTPNSPQNFQLPKLQNDRLNNLDFKFQEIPIRNEAKSKCNASYRERERERERE